MPGQGFFSCCTIHLHGILIYFNSEHALPKTVDSTEQFLFYKTPETWQQDIKHDYFALNPPDAPVVVYQDRPVYITDVDAEEQYSDYRYLNYQALGPFMQRYFSPSSVIATTVQELLEKYALDPSNTCVLFFRGNDKVTEVTLPTYDQFIQEGRRRLKEDPQLRFLVQSDETEFLNAMREAFPDNHVIFYDEIRHMPKNNETTVDKIHRYQNAIMSKYYLAITFIMSMCKYVVCSTGNCSMWIMLFRGSADGLTQFCYDTCTKIATTPQLPSAVHCTPKKPAADSPDPPDPVPPTPTETPSETETPTGTLTVAHTADFFTCATLLLERILDYVNTYHTFPTCIQTADLFTWYKMQRHSPQDIRTEYFLDPEPATATTTATDHRIQLTDKPVEPSCVQYKYLNYPEVAPLVKRYFSPSRIIQSIVSELKEKYDVDPTKTCVLFHRGHDTLPGTSHLTYHHYIQTAQSLLRTTPDLRFWVQSDETEFLTAMKEAFPTQHVIFSDEIRHMPRNPQTSVDKRFFSQNYVMSKYFLAIVHIASECRYVVCGSDHSSLWMALFRGHADGITQFNYRLKD